ncbi:DinB family protein [Spirochaeta cellobiosiphila]|uniref:DinB family protein n=1 Tax=Spirochaeta cellobiosiphila TaxID=504483 RepID=UPI0004013F4B|nr:DinB family protein [Spirochaeta cellobiosiphila]
MDKQTLILLAQYNRAANLEMNQLIKSLTDDQWNQRFKAFFSSLKSMCNHIYVADNVWLYRFSQLRTFEYVKSLGSTSPLSFKELYTPTISEYLTKRDITDQLLQEFVEEITQEDIDSDLTYLDSRGGEHSHNFGDLALHMFNHQTHHRGMISVYLEGLDIDNDFNSIMSYL